MQTDRHTDNSKCRTPTTVQNMRFWETECRKIVLLISHRATQSAQSDAEPPRCIHLTTTPGFCFHFRKCSLTRHDCSLGSNPVMWISHNFCTHSQLVFDDICDVCLLIPCKTFIAWILLELSKGYLLWVIAGCKLHKVCFCLPMFCQKLELVIS